MKHQRNGGWWLFPTGAGNKHSEIEIKISINIEWCYPEGDVRTTQTYAVRSGVPEIQNRANIMCLSVSERYLSASFGKRKNDVFSVVPV